MEAANKEAKYRVVIDGHIIAGAAQQDVVKKLARLFGTPAERVAAMLTGEATVIKSNLPKARAYQYLRTISNAGAACHIDRLEATGPEQTVQMPAFNDDINDTPSTRLAIDEVHLGSIEEMKQWFKDKKEYSELIQAREVELKQKRNKSDLLIISLFFALLITTVTLLLLIF